ncbi:hypothetical protein K503DRAFT_669066, partial [Rhizopogon vinicolor AM-OR11-026]
VDNQAAIIATHSFDAKRTHYVMDRFHDILLKALTALDVNTISIRSTPGHVSVGIEGNEIADVEAQKVAQGLTSDATALRTLRKG